MSHSGGSSLPYPADAGAPDVTIPEDKMLFNSALLIKKSCCIHQRLFSLFSGGIFESIIIPCPWMPDEIILQYTFEDLVENGEYFY